MWAMNPIPGVRLTLISPDWKTPYSGMLPGLLAGHYASNDIHIDLHKVCHWAGVRFIQAPVCGLNCEDRVLNLEHHPSITYDVLSINIGSTPDLSITGLAEFAQAVKPIDKFYPRYLACIERCERQLSGSSDQQVIRLSVIGGGAGGIEVTLALAERLSKYKQQISITLVVRGSDLLNNYPSNVRSSVKDKLLELGVEIEFDFDLVRVERGTIFSTKGRTLSSDEVFFCTDARGASWPSQSQLNCDKKGFVHVNSFLQSENQSSVFATGDIASMTDNPRAKAGVYAVRQAPILFSNLKNYLTGKPLDSYIPQDTFMSLVSLGAKEAVLSRGHFSITHSFCRHALWVWKDRIDRQFMSQFQRLTPIKMKAADNIDSNLIKANDQAAIRNHKVRCAGCGSKVGSSILQNVLREVTGKTVFEPEDGAVLSLPNQTLIQTVDQITSPFDQPYLFGKISTLHALSDAFAMNATPLSVQVLLSLPYAVEAVQQQELVLIMKGVMDVLSEHNCELVGGHTSEAQELSLGFTVNASTKAHKPLFRKANLNNGDYLVLTKPLGTGVILAADMQNMTNGEWHNEAVNSMLKSNAKAAAFFSSIGINACTDVTGFGLVGHLSEMLNSAQCSAEISISSIPLIKGAQSLSDLGIRSSLYEQNLKVTAPLSIDDTIVNHPKFPLLFDPQTSGGLLAGLNEDALQTLKATKTTNYYVIGRVIRQNKSGWDLSFTE